MNVLLINGSPHKDGCTNAALAEMAKALNEADIETTIFHIGSAPVGGCVGCGGCGKAEEAAADAEGMQIMRNLSRNMAWILRCIEAGKAAGIEAPVAENDKRTNFIR